MSPVNAALQFKLVVGLDIKKEMLVEANACNQMSPVGTFQGAPAVDVLKIRKGKKNKLREPLPLPQPVHLTEEISFRIPTTSLFPYKLPL